MRRGFGILQALLVIVLISGIMTIAMKYATVSAKQTKDMYIKESAELFMDSAVELSLLAISGYERNSTNECLKDVNVTSSDRRFTADINISRYYLLDGSDDCGFCDPRCQPIQTEESHGMVMLQVTVESNNTHPKNGKTEIKLRRRTIQRP